MSTITPPKDKAEQAERLRAVLADIEANPEHWCQRSWHCNTSHCFAGFAQLRSLGLSPETHEDECLSFHGTAMDDAATFLGLQIDCDDYEEGHPLFNYRNTLEDLRRIVNKIIAMSNPCPT